MSKITSRFFPNGQVLSLLANEEKHPQEIIPLLKPSLRMKGLFVGHWKLVGTTVCLSNLIDASGRFPLPASSILPSPVFSVFPVDGGRSLGSGAASGSAGANFGHASTQAYGQGHGRGSGHSQRQTGSSLSTQTDTARYVFDMTLNLRSKPLGRWNRMDIQSYDSVNLENGDVHPVALKHERPFWFSMVRSYT
jgi:F-box protein 9